MGFWDYIRSFWEPPSKAQFVRLFLKEARQVRPETQFTYNEANFAIHYGEDGLVNLTNFYQEYLQLSREHRPAALKRFVGALLVSGNFEIPADFEDVHPDLLPVIRSRMYFESARLQAATSKKTLNAPADFPFQILAGNLAVSLVYDLPNVMQSILGDQLQTWGVTLYEAIEAATENLKQMGSVQIVQLGKGTYVSCSGDNYDASRLLLSGLLDQLEVKGDLIAMVPNRDLLIITGSEDLEGQESMLALGFQSLQQPRPISTFALRREFGGFSVWLPDAASPHYKQFKELQQQTIGQEYVDQKDLLDQLHEACQEDVFVASYQLLEANSGNRTSFTVWSKGIPTLLPEADAIVLAVFDSTPGDVPSEKAKVAESLVVPWEAVRQQCSHLMTPTDYYPPRWKVESFPDEEDLAKLRQVPPPQ